MSYLQKAKLWEQTQRVEVKREIRKMGKVVDLETIRKMFGGTYVDCEHPFIDTQEVKP